jgi:AmmeMemoRadiSam system protein A
MPDSSSNSKMLLELARNAIETFVTTGRHLEIPTPSADLAVKRGCFVTLRKLGELRGCVGTFEAQTPLYENIIRIAPAAAVQDPRFPPVTKNELPHLKIELSVLGELEKVESLEEIEIGKHGVYVKLGDRSGTYLPDVAVEQKWSVHEFVMHCAREKARLSTEEIMRAEIFRYPVQKYKE